MLIVYLQHCYFAHPLSPFRLCYHRIRLRCHLYGSPAKRYASALYARGFLSEEVQKTYSPPRKIKAGFPRENITISSDGSLCCTLRLCAPFSPFRIGSRKRSAMPYQRFRLVLRAFTGLKRPKYPFRILRVRIASYRTDSFGSLSSPFSLTFLRSTPTGSSRGRFATVPVAAVASVALDEPLTCTVAGVLL